MFSAEHRPGVESDELLASLQQMGFSSEQAARLAFMHAHLQNGVEYQERLALQRRLQFARWLVHTGRLKQ
jgi:hypothetical protein